MRIGIAIRAQQLVDRNREGQQRPAFAARHLAAVNVERMPAALADHLVRPRHGLQAGAAAAAFVQIGLQGLQLVIFAGQPVQLQQLLSVFRREMRQPALAKGRIFHAQRHAGGSPIRIHAIHAHLVHQGVGHFHLLLEQRGIRPKVTGDPPGAAGGRDTLEPGYQRRHFGLEPGLARIKILDQRAFGHVVHQQLAKRQVGLCARRSRHGTFLQPLREYLAVQAAIRVPVVAVVGFHQRVLQRRDQAVEDRVGQPGVGIGISEPEIVIHQRAAVVAVDIGGRRWQRLGCAALAAADPLDELRMGFQRGWQFIALARQSR